MHKSASLLLVASALLLCLAPALAQKSDSPLGPMKNFWEVVLDCDGVLHIAPKKWYNINVDLSGVKRLANSTIEVLRSRATCQCPSIGTEFDEHMDPFFVALNVIEKGADGLKWQSQCAKNNFKIANGWESEEAESSGLVSALDQLAAQTMLPSTCSVDSWNRDGRCGVKYVEDGSSTLSFAVSKCPNSVVPAVYLSIDLPSAVLSDDGEVNICGSDSDCDGGSCFVLATPDKLTTALVDLGLYSDPAEALNGAKQCMSGSEFMTGFFQNLYSRFGSFNVHADKGLGVCLNMRTRQQLSAMPLPWDGKLLNGENAFDEGFTSGSALPKGGLFTSRPTEGSWTSMMGTACDQVYLFLFKHFGISIEMPAMPYFLKDVYTLVTRLESCRSGNFFNSQLDAIALETRFKPWGLLSWLYQVSSPAPSRDIGDLAMSDWRLITPQPWCGVDEEGKAMQCLNSSLYKNIDPPKSASYDSMVSNDAATFTWKGLESCPLFDNPKPSTLDISFAGRRCSVEPEALPEAGVWIQKAALELSKCTSDSECPHSGVCTSFGEIMAENGDMLGEWFFTNPKLAAKCISPARFQNDVHTLLLALEGQGAASDDIPLSFCSPKIASGGTDTALRFMAWTTAQGFYNRPLHMQSMSEWQEPVYADWVGPASNSNTKVIVGAVGGVTGIAVLLAVGAFFLRKNQRVRRLLRHHELQEAVPAPSAPAMIATSV